MATFTEVRDKLSCLPLGTYKLSEIVDEIKSIPSPKHKKQVILANQNQSDMTAYFGRCGKHDLNDVWVDISYQRSLKLKKIFDHLGMIDQDGKPVEFDPMLCGTVEFSIRRSGKVFVWDGFRRCIMAMVKGIDKIPSNDVTQPDGWTNKQCQMREAFAFSKKNSAMESMKKEELFKAGVAQNDKYYMGIKDTLSKCELNVLGVHPGMRNLSGYVTFQELATKDPFSDAVSFNEMIPSTDFLKDASLMIQKAWPREEVSAFMLGGLACYLYKTALGSNNGGKHCLPIELIEDRLMEYVNKGGTTGTCTKDRLHSSPIETVAWRICKNVFKMSKIDSSKFIGMNDDQTDTLGLSKKNSLN